MTYDQLLLACIAIIAFHNTKVYTSGVKWNGLSNSNLYLVTEENGMWAPDRLNLVGLHESSEKLYDDVNKNNISPSEAVFKTPNNTFITVQVGSPATLRCRVENVADHETVSWVRRRDHHLISLGSSIYTSNDRFQLTRSADTHEWTLNLKQSQLVDSGMYECQLSTYPPIGILTTLKIIQPVAVIKGSPEMFAEAGSDVSLICRLRNFTNPPSFVFWYHGNQMINYEADRKISVSNQGGTSILKLKGLQHRHSGNYTCQPAYAKPAAISLQVIPGEFPAAAQEASAKCNYHVTSIILTCFFFTSFIS